MAYTSIYLNFMGTTESAFMYYQSVFQTQFATPIMKMKDIPAQPGMPEMSAADKEKVMHVSLPILGGLLLMGTDMLESAGHKLVEGNNFTISLTPDSKEETDLLYAKLSDGGSEAVPPHDEFWGYWGVCKDKFGIRWMFNLPK